MGQVTESTHLGIACGSCCSVFMIVFSVIYCLISLGATLFARIYLRGFYTAAHIAGWSVLVGIFVIAHHGFKIRQSLGISLKTHCVIQTIFNVWHLLAWAVCGAAYTYLTTLTIHLNFDYIASSIWAWMNVLLMLYLTVLVTRASKFSRYSKYELRPSSWHYESAGKDIQLQTRSENGSMDRMRPAGSEASLVTTNSNSSSKCCKKCKKCCRVFWHLVFGLFYFLFHLIAMVLVAATVYYPFVVILDTIKYEPHQHMYTVQVGEHRPLALYLECRGNGTETVVMENGLGSQAYFGWSFIPRMLAKHRFKVCVSDRRGYGWSEGIVYDKPWLYFTEPQNAISNIEFFKALVDTAEIPKPFYYAGHSYGGTHLTLMALDYPNYIKGLIYLDSARLSVLDFDILLALGANLQATGLIQAGEKLKLFDFTTIEPNIEFNKMPEDVLSEVLSTSLNGYFFSTYGREKAELIAKESEDQVGLENRNVTIDKPVLVIDAGEWDRAKNWFPKQYFSRYVEKSNHKTFPGATHVGLVMTTKYAANVTDLINNFIRTGSAL